MKPDIVRRYRHNPILTKADIPYPVETVHNAAVAKHENEYIMLFRSHLRTGRSIIGLARSPDGFHFTADPEPFLTPARDSPFAAYEEFGVEDPRVTHMDGEYLITYSAYSRNGVRIALAKTKDFSHVERISLITEADYRNVVIFPEKFDGLYARLDRPHSEIAPWSIWISYSPDLCYWGQSQLIMKPEPYHWDEMKIGPGAPPIKTDQGWLSIYHGVFRTMPASRQTGKVSMAFQEFSNIPEWYSIPGAALAFMPLPLVIQYRVKARKLTIRPPQRICVRASCPGLNKIPFQVVQLFANHK